MTTATPSTPRKPRRTPATPFAAGLPDPRPVTDYTVALSVVAGKSRLTVTLTQPCVVRSPRWAVIDCTNGGRVYPTSVTVVGPTSFHLDFAGLLSPAIGFVEAPYQDPEVQNAMGGFVVPGGKWFREPVMP